MFVGGVANTCGCAVGGYLLSRPCMGGFAISCSFFLLHSVIATHRFIIHVTRTTVLFLNLRLNFQLIFNQQISFRRRGLQCASATPPPPHRPLDTLWPKITCLNIPQLKYTYKHLQNLLLRSFQTNSSAYVTAHGKTYVNDLRKHSLKSFVDRSLVVRNFYPFVKSSQ